MADDLLQQDASVIYKDTVVLTFCTLGCPENTLTSLQEFDTNYSSKFVRFNAMDDKKKVGSQSITKINTYNIQMGYRVDRAIKKRVKKSPKMGKIAEKPPKITLLNLINSMYELQLESCAVDIIAKNINS